MKTYDEDVVKAALPARCALCPHHEQYGANLSQAVCTHGGRRTFAEGYLPPADWCPLRHPKET